MMCRLLSKECKFIVPSQKAENQAADVSLTLSNINKLNVR